MEKHVYRFAGHTVEICSLYPQIHTMCSEYRTEDRPELFLSIRQSDIDDERRRSEEEGRAGGARDRHSHDAYLETLEITDTREYFHSVYGIAYNPARDQYVMAIRGGYDFAIFDSRFELPRYVKGVDTRFVKQGIDCDDNYIYFATSEENADTRAGAYTGWSLTGASWQGETMAGDRSRKRGKG